MVECLKPVDTARNPYWQAVRAAHNPIKRIVAAQPLRQRCVKRGQKLAQVIERRLGFGEARTFDARRQQIAAPPVGGDKSWQGYRTAFPHFGFRRVRVKVGAPHPEHVGCASVAKRDIVIAQSARKRLKIGDVGEVPMRDERREARLKHGPAWRRTRAVPGRDRVDEDVRSSRSRGASRSTARPSRQCVRARKSS